MNRSHPDNPDSTDPEISDSLRRIVPENLSAAGLVEGARRKRHRRHGMLGAAAALVMVAVAVPVAVNLQHDAITAQPAATPSAVSALPGAQACYNDDGTPISWAQDDATEPAEPGAVKAWFCGDYSPETGQGFVGPLEPLTSGLDAIIEDVQAADGIDLTVTTCMDDYNLTFNAVFEYPDGTRRIIGGDRHGCRTTYDGGVTRAGAEEFYGALYAAWEKQRETDTGDWVVPNICPGPLSLIGMQPGDAVQASICGEGADGSWSAAYLSEDLVEEVTESMRTLRESPEGDTQQPQSFAPEQRVWLSLSNTFTDYLGFVRHEDGLYRAHDGEGLEWFWEPSQELSSRLDEALASATSTDGPPAAQPVGSTAPDGDGTPVGPDTPSGEDQPPLAWVADGCHDASTGELVSTDIPGGTLPGGADRVWLCANGQAQAGAPTPPMEALDDGGLVASATSAFNALEPMPADQPCTLELGPSYLAVYEYADGTRHAVELQDFGCHFVMAGDTVKANSGLYMETLLGLWGEQRATAETVQTRPGPLCPLTSSVFTIDPANATLSSGAACVGGGDVDGVTQLAGDEVALPGALVSDVVAQLAEAPEETVVIGPDGNSIVLLTAAGDPFVLFRQGDGTFYWPDGESAKVWTPKGPLAESLASVFEG